MSEEKRKYVCRNHPETDAFVDVGFDLDPRYLCRACYKELVKTREKMNQEIKKKMRCKPT